MEVRIAKIISALLHPLLMPTYGFLLVFYTHNHISTFTQPNIKLVILGVTFVFTFLLPTLNALILLKMGRINSLEMETSTERVLPYATTAIYYFALFYLFYSAEFPVLFKIVILGAGISILLTLFINFFWKISAHAVGIGGIGGAALGSMYRSHMELLPAFLIIVIFAGIVGYARLKLNAHNPSQIYAGYALGFVIELGLMLFY